LGIFCGKHKNPVKDSLVSVARVKPVKIRGYFSTASVKKPAKDSLVSVARVEPAKIRGYFWRPNKTAENNFSFDGYYQNRRKYFQPPQNDSISCSVGSSATRVHPACLVA
jgi:hypothetical protein